jgi:hypothetical protein
LLINLTIPSRDVLVTAARVLKLAAAFLKLEGPISEGINIDGGNLAKANKPVVFGQGVTEKAARIR